MERIRELFEELNFPGVERLKKALKNRGIPFTKKQVNELTKGESVRQVQQAAPPLTGKVAAHYENYEWQADLIQWDTAPSASTKEGGVKKKDPEKFILVVHDVFSRKYGQRLLRLNSQPMSNEPSSGSLIEQMSCFRQTD